MPRVANETTALLKDLKARLGEVVAAARAEGRASALSQLHAILGGPAKRGPGRPRGSRNKPKAVAGPRKRRRNPWAGLSPEQRLARVNAIRKGRGLPTKTTL